jgi:hypothetical protein
MSYTHQVNYSKRFLNGMLAGRLYHDHLRFGSKASAEEFAAMEGQTLTTCDGTGWKYTLEDMTVIDLAKFA